MPVATGPCPHRAAGPGWTLGLSPPALTHPVRCPQLLSSAAGRQGNGGWRREVRAPGPSPWWPKSVSPPDPTLVLFSTAALLPRWWRWLCRRITPRPSESTIHSTAIPSQHGTRGHIRAGSEAPLGPGEPRGHREPWRHNGM